MDHRVHRQPIDQKVTTRSPESSFPFDWINDCRCLFLEQAEVTLNPRGRIITRCLRGQRETEKLGQIALRRTNSRKLPVISAQTLRDATSAAEHNISRIEIVVN